MSSKFQLSWPLLGRSDEAARADQPPATTRRAFNVRAMDPVTRRSRGAQRAGMSPFFTGAAGSRVDHLAAISYNVPKIGYTLLTESDNGTTTPAVITPEWTETPGFVVAVRTDRDGQVYALTQDGRVLIYNPDAVLVDTITVPLNPGESVDGALAVDEARRVYVGAYRAGPPTGTLSRVFQWRRITDPDDDTVTYYDLAWTQDIQGRVRNLVATAGGLWMIRQAATESGGDAVEKLGAVNTPTPLVEWTVSTPAPTLSIDVGSTGAVYVTSPANPARGSSQQLNGLHPSQRSWLPHDLGYDADAIDTELSAQNRLHAWVDTAANTWENYSKIAGVTDRRYVDTQRTETQAGQLPGSLAGPAEYADGPHDTTVRYITQQGGVGRPGPTAVNEGWAGRTLANFDRTDDSLNNGFPGQALRGNANASNGFKADTTPPEDAGNVTGTDTSILLTDSFQLITGITITLSGNTHNNGYLTMALVFRVTVLLSSYVELQVLRDGVPVSNGIQVSLGAGTNYAVQAGIPVVYSTDQDGDYTVRALAPSATGVTISPVSGTPPQATLYYNDAAPDQDGVWPQQASIVPGPRSDGYAGAGDNWVACSTWRMDDPSAGIMVLASQKGNVHQWALLGHAKITNGVLAHEPGWVTFISSQMFGGSSSTFTVPGLGTQGFFLGWHGVSQDTNISGLNPGYYALVTIGVSGPTQGAEDPEPNYTSYFRVNGTPAGRFSIKAIDAWGPSSYVLLGNKYAGETPHPNDLFDQTIPFLPFHGQWSSWVTVLGSTSDPDITANDVATSCPTEGGGGVPTGSDLPPAAGAASGTIDITAIPYNDEPPDDSVTPSYTGSATEVERLEGGLAHEWGLSNFLPTTSGGGPNTFNYHPFGGSGLIPIGFSTGPPVDALGGILGSPRPVLAKIGPNGAGVLWAVNGSGLGSSVAADQDGRHIVTVGQKDALDVDNEDVVMRRTYDGGNTYSFDAADDAWTHEDGGFTPTWFNPRIVLDSQGNAYWARQENGTTTKHSITNGDVLWTYTDPAAAQTDSLRQVDLDPTIPIYPSATNDEDQTPLFFYTAGRTLRKLRMVAETQTVGASNSPRMTRYLATAGADLLRGDSGSGATAPTGGTGVFDAARTFLSSAVLFGKLYLTDGRNYVVYDPLEDTARTLESSTRGEIPKRGRLMTAWNGRLVIARTQDGPTAWYMSKQGDPTNWDYFPPNPSVQDAVNGDSSRGPGRVPDAITALVPLDDSTLLIGCDSRIYAMRGDPLGGMRLDSSQGGRLDLMTDEIGMAFGRSTTRSPDGGVYFFGQRGGVYRATANGVERITQRTIEKELQDVDLSTYRAEMVWDYRAEGPHVFLFEHRDNGDPALVPSYHFDAQNGGWWPDSYADASVQPTACAVFDGDDPDDRVVALGFQGGEVRFIDSNAVDDDGTDIASEVWLGPFSLGLPDSEARFSHLQAALAADQGPASFAWYVSDDPDLDLASPGTAVASGAWAAGLNPVNYARARGLYVWLRITGGSDNTRWALEAASMEATPGGRARVRS